MELGADSIDLQGIADHLCAVGTEVDTMVLLEYPTLSTLLSYLERELIGATVSQAEEGERRVQSNVHDVFRVRLP